jgi:hypothetical protein
MIRQTFFNLHNIYSILKFGFGVVVIGPRSSLMAVGWVSPKNTKLILYMRFARLIRRR